MKNFFETLKVERICQGGHETRELARLDIADHREGFDNRQRVKSSVGYRTPLGVESILNAA